MFASLSSATSSSKILSGTLFCILQVPISARDLRLCHLFTGSECSYSSMRLTASSGAVGIVAPGSWLHFAPIIWRRAGAPVYTTLIDVAFITS